MAIAAGGVKLRLLIAVGDEGEPHEVATLTVPLRVTQDRPRQATIHVGETVRAIETAIQSLARAIEGQA